MDPPPYTTTTTTTTTTATHSTPQGFVSVFVVVVGLIMMFSVCALMIQGRNTTRYVVHNHHTSPNTPLNEAPPPYTEVAVSI